jgi:ribosomal peptide maturation radical SAM protein 1
VARHLKARNQGIVTVMGGANCEAPMGQELVSGSSHLDYVFSGPALVSFPRFIEHLRRGERDRIAGIAGVFDRNTAAAQRGKTIIGDELDINELIDLDYGPFIELVRTRYPNRDLEVILPFETSRGCWWGERAHCTFCGLNGISMGYRSMDPDKAHALISSLFRYAPLANRLECVDNIMPRNYVDGVFSRLDTPDSMQIFYEVKADLSEADLRTLSLARVRILQPGIEALATSTLKLMRKGTTSFNNITFLMHCARYEIHPVWNLLIGFPGEPTTVYEKYLRDLPKLVHLPPPVGVYPVRFDRFSPYFNEAERYGLQLHPLPFYELIYPFDRQSFTNMAYFFGDQNYRAEYLKGVVQYIGPLQRAIDAWIKLWESGQRPELSVSQAEGRTVVHDSRSGTLRTYELSKTAADIIGVIGRRRTRGEIGNALRPCAETELQAGLRELQERDLVFEESEMFMSLFMPQPATVPVREVESVLS